MHPSRHQLIPNHSPLPVWVRLTVQPSSKLHAGKFRIAPRSVMCLGSFDHVGAGDAVDVTGKGLAVLVHDEWWSLLVKRVEKVLKVVKGKGQDVHGLWW